MGTPPLGFRLYHRQTLGLLLTSEWKKWTGYVQTARIAYRRATDWEFTLESTQSDPTVIIR